MNTIRKYLPVVAVMALSTAGAFAEPAPAIGDVIDSASDVLTSVIAVCITAAVFFVGLRFAKRVTRG